MRIASIRSFGLGLALAFVASATFAAGGTLSVSEKADLSAPAASVWGAIKDFNGWQGWHPVIANSELAKGKNNTKGAVRILTTKDGARITEELVAYNASGMTYSYRIIDSPLPVTNYTSTLKVAKTKAGGSTFVWSSKFKAKAGTSDDEAKKVIAGIYRAGLDNVATVVK
jgi:hypothetical protein